MAKFVIPYLVSTETNINAFAFIIKAKDQNEAIEYLCRNLENDFEVGPIFYDSNDIIDEVDYVLINKNYIQKI